MVRSERRKRSESRGGLEGKRDQRSISSDGMGITREKYVKDELNGLKDWLEVARIEATRDWRERGITIEEVME